MYNGHETKVMINGSTVRTKNSSAYNLMNKCLVGIVLFQMLLCLICSFSYTLISSKLYDYYYLKDLLGYQ